MSTSTLKSIAEATGFSVTTVSRALGGYDDVNEQTRRIILDEAQRQGYQPNLHARALQGQKAHTVGLIMPASGPRFSDPFFREFVAGVGNQAAVEGFDLLLSTHAPTPDELDIYSRMVAGRRVDGMVLVRTRRDDPRINYLVKTSMPFVVYGRTHTENDYVHIDIDGVTGQRVLTQHFIDLGHRQIAYITAPQNLMFSYYRIQGFREAMTSSDLSVDARYVIEGEELTERAGRQAAHSLLNLENPPTAIMTGNDLMAFGVMSAIQERGMRVGHDVAVGGFDDVPAAEHIHPGLTTVHQPIYEIGQQLTRMLLDLITGKEVADHAILIEPTLIIRASSGSSRF